MSEHTHIFDVRGRPVGFVPSPYGGALVAIERGFFPVSPTGYRSLASAFGKNPSPDTICADLLASLALSYDQRRRETITEIRRAHMLSADSLSNFISASMAAHRAIEDGFFAPNANAFRGFNI